MNTITIAAILASLTLGCKDSNSDTESLEQRSVTIKFGHKVDDKPLAFDQLVFENAAGNQYSVSRLQYILTDMYLLDENGEKTIIISEKYIDASGDSSAETVTVPSTPTSLSFVFGISPANKPDGLPDAMDFNNMVWPEAMGGGYHYMKLEGSYQNGDAGKAFLVHTGPTGGQDRSIDLQVTVPSDGSGDTFVLEMDINQWFEGDTNYDFKSYDGMIMGNPGAQEILRANGQNVFNLRAE